MSTRLGGVAGRRQPDSRRVARAALLGLHGRLDPSAERLVEILLDAVPSVSDDDHHLSTARVYRRADRVVHEGPAGNRVEHLRQGALHARTVSGR